MKKKPTDIPVILSLEQINQGIILSIKSANGLMKAARMVYKKEPYKLAPFLSTMSLEEAGKAILIYRALLIKPDDFKGWKLFWGKQLQNHRQKILAGYTLIQSSNFFNLEWDTQWGKFVFEQPHIKDILAEIEDDKFASIYVDFNSKKNKFEHEPPSLINCEIMLEQRSYIINYLEHLSKSGCFAVSNLKKLQDVYRDGEGRALLDRYRSEKKLKSDSQFLSTHNAFIREQGLEALQNSWSDSLKAVLGKIFKGGSHKISPLGKWWLNQRWKLMVKLGDWIREAEKSQA